jgi:hypothetical protein
MIITYHFWHGSRSGSATSLGGRFFSVSGSKTGWRRRSKVEWPDSSLGWSVPAKTKLKNKK